MFDVISSFALEKLAWRFCNYLRFSYRTPYWKKKKKKKKTKKKKRKLNKNKNEIVAVIPTMESFTLYVLFNNRLRYYERIEKIPSENS